MSTRTRTADEIYEDISGAMLDGAGGGGMPMDEWRVFYAEKTRRVHALWDELGRLVATDRDVPAWASVAVLLVRDQYAREMRDL